MLINGTNLTVSNNNLSGDGTAMYLDSFSTVAPFTTPVVGSGNTVTGSSNGFQLFNPGSPTDRRRQPHHTMGRAQARNGSIAFEVVALDR